jgi:hypothetical protein
LGIGDEGFGRLVLREDLRLQSRDLRLERFSFGLHLDLLTLQIAPSGNLQRIWDFSHRPPDAHQAVMTEPELTLSCLFVSSTC